MKINQIILALESVAPLAYQEVYDNAGLLTGSAEMQCTGVLCTLDATEDIIKEAIQKRCNLVVAHHPILFKGITKINGKNYVEKVLILAIKNDIAIYAIHTNLDNIFGGVNSKIAQKLGLINSKILLPTSKNLVKLITFAPKEYANTILEALFEAGAGNIGNYSEASFTISGEGTFKGSENANPTIGEKGTRTTLNEQRIEVILPSYLQEKVIFALKKAHLYEEVAYDLIPLNNENQLVGSGMIGELKEEMNENDFLEQIKAAFDLKVIKHTPLLRKKINKIAICGGAGSFLIPVAKAAKADFFISSDIKYHEFFEADNQFVIADIGHWESEQYTTDLLFALLTTKFPNFAVLKTAINTNPVSYFLG